MSLKNNTIQRGSRIVGFDMDGVIIDHAPNKIMLAKQYAVTLFPEETHSEFLSGKFPREEYLAFQNTLYGDSEFALSAPLMPGAFDVLQELKDRSIPFVLISRRRVPENAVKLLKERKLWGDLFSDENAFFVGTPEEKNIASVREGVTHFFDDERKVLRAIPDVKRRFLFDSLHQFNDEQEFERVFDWHMLRRIVLEEEKKTESA